MIHIEQNLSPSGFVPSLPQNEQEAPQTIQSVNGHTIESLESTHAFNKSCGCELDRLISASKELRSAINSDSIKNAQSLAKTLKLK